MQENAEYNRAIELEELNTADYKMLSLDDQNRLKELQLEAPRKVFSHMNEVAVVWVVCLIIMLYTITGGLEAAFFIRSHPGDVHHHAFDNSTSLCMGKDKCDLWW